MHELNLILKGLICYVVQFYNNNKLDCSCLQVSTVYMMGSLRLPATFLIFVSALALLTSLLGLSFPYSAANQCPKRVFFQVRIMCQVAGLVWSHMNGLMYIMQLLKGKQNKFPQPQNNNSWCENKTIMAGYKSCCTSENYH